MQNRKGKKTQNNALVDQCHCVQGHLHSRTIQIYIMLTKLSSHTEQPYIVKDTWPYIEQLSSTV